MGRKTATLGPGRGRQQIPLPDALVGAANLFEVSAWVCIATLIRAESMGLPIVEVAAHDPETGEWGEKLPAHPLSALLKKPNPQCKWEQLVGTDQAWMTLLGNSFIRKRKDGLGLTRELHFLHPEYVAVLADGDGLKGYQMLLSGKMVSFPADRIIHRRKFSTKSSFWGSSVLQTLRNDVSADRHATGWNANFFKKGGLPSVWFRPQEDLSHHQLRGLRQRIEREFGGLKNQGRPGVLPMELDATLLNLPHKDIEWLAGQQWSREKIGTALGVPPYLMGQWTSVAYNNVEAQEKTFWRSIKVALEDLLADLNDWVAPEFDELFGPARVRVNKHSMDQLIESADRRMDRWRRMVDRGIVTINEAREEFDLPRYEDPMASQLLVPANLVPISQVGQKPEAPEEIPGGIGGALQRPNTDPAPQESRWNETQRKVLRRAFQKDQDSEAAKLRAVAKRILDRWVEDLKRQLGRGVPYDSIQPDSSALFDQLLDGVRAEKLRIVERQARRMLARVEQARPKAFGDPLDEILNPDSDFMRRVLAGELYANFQHLSAELGQRVREILVEAASESLPISETQAKLVDVVGSESRAEKIARTETTSALNAGNEAGYAAGGITHKSWITTGLQNVRDSHSAQERARPTPVGEMFLIVRGLFPGDPQMPAKEAVHCNCTTAPEFEDDAKAASFIHFLTKQIEADEDPGQAALQARRNGHR